MRVLLQVLAASPDGLQAKDAVVAVRDKVELAPEEQGAFETSGAEKFPKLVRFATLPVARAGWMQKHDGIWTVTAEGETALNTYSDPEVFWKQALALYAEWKKEVVVDATDEDASEEEVSEAVSIEDAEDEARSEILDFIANMPPFDFQSACAKLVAALGHRVAWISPPGPTAELTLLHTQIPLAPPASA